jgi:hypothetical protein
MPSLVRSLHRPAVLAAGLASLGATPVNSSFAETPDAPEVGRNLTWFDEYVWERAGSDPTGIAVPAGMKAQDYRTVRPSNLRLLEFVVDPEATKRPDDRRIRRVQQRHDDRRLDHGLTVIEFTDGSRTERPMLPGKKHGEEKHSAPDGKLRETRRYADGAVTTGR